MATGRKGFQPTDEVGTFNPAVSAQKMPANIARGRKVRTDYLDIPVDRFVPYQNKQGSDFSRMEAARLDGLADSIKEDGILQAIVARPIQDDLFEILAGETRWTAAKRAGIPTVPTRLIPDCDDDRARRIFSASNMWGRELKIRDKVNGWWHYWEGARMKQGRKSQQALQDDLETVSEIMSAGDGTSSRSAQKITIRQIQKYHKVHSLQEPLLQKLDNGELSLEAAYNLAFLTVDQQLDICKWWRPVSQNMSIQLRALAEQPGAWSKESVDDLFIVAGPKEKDAYTKTVNNAMKRLRRMITNKVAPNAVSRLDDIMSEALKLYFKEHPEDQRDD